ncbi:helix-hairpin-helix domain-containing protein [Flavobacteriaceae bacterium AU392]|nr:helix-hairpin-helix domain-containing protein [Flavobacteriaceae bacterium]RKM81163.1 helix-hairpin-helix domain-containing protein [Flavobacteriaceae bacterium AU392]
MNKLKSHFQFSKKQRSGIFILLLLIIICQCIYFFIEIPPEDIAIDDNELQRFQKEIDSLRLVRLENNKPKIYPFNPNFITDYKGYTLGMTNEEIDRLLKFRSKDRWINSSKQFQEITKISDSLLRAISPYFKFPNWIKTPKPIALNASNTIIKTYTQKRDLNTATTLQLQRVYGIGKTLSKRIVDYRNKFKGGFISDIELQDIYGLSLETIRQLTNEFTVKTPRKVRKVNLNTATKNELVTIQYIDYELADEIIEQRVLREGFKTLDELTKVKGFPGNKIDIIKLYLTLN